MSDLARSKISHRLQVDTRVFYIISQKAEPRQGLRGGLGRQKNIVILA